MPLDNSQRFTFSGFFFGQGEQIKYFHVPLIKVTYAGINTKSLKYFLSLTTSLVFLRLDRHKSKDASNKNRCENGGRIVY
jgi:hypothetical protein